MATDHSARAPTFVVTVDGSDITRSIDARLISLELAEGRGDEADQLDITLDDSDGRLALPPRGARISLLLGWVGESLVDKGDFEVDEIEHSGAPDQVRVSARAADMRGPIRRRTDHSWHQQTLSQIVRAIAARNGLGAKVADALAGTVIEHIDQTNESDLHFVSRLARQFDATATVKKRTLIVLPIDSHTTADGQALEQVTITRAAGDQHRWHSADRDSYSGVRASWYDKRTARRRHVRAGSEQNEKRLKDTHATEADALAAADSELRRIQRGMATLEITLAEGRPELMPQSPANVAGFKPEIDSTDWLVVKVTHTIDDGGFNTRVEMERSG